MYDVDTAERTEACGESFGLSRGLRLLLDLGKIDN